MVLEINGDEIWKLGYRGTYGYLVTVHSDKSPWYPAYTTTTVEKIDRIKELLKIVEDKCKCKDCTAISYETMNIPLAETSRREEIEEAIEKGEFMRIKTVVVYVSDKILDCLNLKYVDDFGLIIYWYVRR